MIAVRIHGRGGQGVVTAAELLSVAAFDDGRCAQAFPSFGSERTGAPVVAFCRIDEREIRLREPIDDADAVIVQDPTLLHQIDVFAGLRSGGLALINTSRAAAALGLEGLNADVHTVPASEIARQHLGRPLPGAPLLGAFAALSEAVSLDAVAAAFCERFPGATGEGNAAAARAAAGAVLERTDA